MKEKEKENKGKRVCERENVRGCKKSIQRKKEEKYSNKRRVNV